MANLFLACCMLLIPTEAMYIVSTPDVAVGATTTWPPTDEDVPDLWIRKHLQNILTSLDRHVRHTAARIAVICSFEDVDETGKIIEDETELCNFYDGGLFAITQILEFLITCYKDQKKAITEESSPDYDELDYLI